MTLRRSHLGLFGLAVGLALAASGCEDSPDPRPEQTSDAGPAKSAPAAEEKAGQVAASETADAEPAPKRTRRPLTLGSAGDGASGAGGAAPAKSAKEKADAILEAMKPLQMVLISDWHGISRKTKQQEELNWKWDLRTDRARPALVMTTKDGHHFREARMTWVDEEGAFRLTATDRDGVERVYRGTFEEPVRDFVGDDNKTQRAYKLKFEQVAPAGDDRLAQVVFNQQENNRYLMEVYERRGSRMQQVDIVGNQREGSSFAFDDSDYGEKTCVVSQGLGTMSVGHKGKTYYVCCTGCKAAFEEDPERWIAKLAEREKDGE